MTSTRHRLFPCLVGALAVVLGACAATATPTPSASQAPSASQSPAAGPSAPSAARPLVIDVDLDASDVLAVAILARDPAFDLRALTVTGTGIVHCASGLRLARGLLDALGRPDVPVACGRESAAGSARAFPDEWRTGADRAWGMSLLEADPGPGTGTASSVISKVAHESTQPVSIFAAGPLTNVADALADDPSLAAHLATVHIMGGVVDAVGNVSLGAVGPGDRLEWNFVADPDSVAAVMASSVPLSLVPLDATDDVPVPAELPAWLESDHTAAGADIAYELLLRLPGRVTDPGSQLWDELAALTMSRADLVTWQDIGLTPTTTGDTAGRIDRDPAGRMVHVAVAADRPRVEAALLESLRRGPPRPAPFTFAGEAKVVWDGASCAWEGALPSKVGVHRLSFENRTANDGGGIVVQVVGPKTWADLEEFLATRNPASQTAPAWLMPIGFLDASAEGHGTSIVDLPAGQSGVVCASGTGPDVTFVTSMPVNLPG